MAGPVVPNQALLNGINPLAYMGVRPTSPALYLVETRDPLTTDKNYALGTWWMNNNAPYNLWRLVNLNAGVATWIMVSSTTGTVISLTSNSGGPVFPLAGNINVVGDGVTIVGVGNPGTHTITLSAVGTGTVEFLAGNTGGNVGPLAGVINVVGDTTGITITGTPGAHTLVASLVGGGIAAQSFPCNTGTATPNGAGVLNVLGANNISTTGAGNTITINGGAYAYTNVTSTPYVVLTTDDYLSVDTTVARTIQLPNAPATGRVFIITDRTGTSGTNNITVTTVGGVVTINGSTTFVMNTNFESIEVIFGVAGYEVF
jgi:hypothetical protein